MIIYGRCISSVVSEHDLTDVGVCFQVWVEEDQRSRRSLSCPFNNTGRWSFWLSSHHTTRWRVGLRCRQSNTGLLMFPDVSIPEVLQRNVWQNVSVSLAPGVTIDQWSILWWNVSAPCRLDGEVWPCYPQRSCRELQGFRQQLKNGSWRQNSKGLWVRQHQYWACLFPY